MAVPNWLDRLRKCHRGNVLALGAAAMPLLVGSAALALDTIQLGLAKRQLQRAADSAALAGAHAVAQEKPAREAVTRDLRLNGQNLVVQSSTVNHAPASGPYRGNPTAVEVVLTLRPDLPFMSFFSRAPVTLSARSVASKMAVGEHCLLALERTRPNAIGLFGNADLQLGCGVASNSTAKDSVKLHGSLELTAPAVHSAGSIFRSANLNFPAAKLHPYGPRQVDPFGTRGRKLALPRHWGGCAAMKFKAGRGSARLQPGHYCGGIEITSTADVTFAPGTYIIDDDFKINGTSSASGEDVTFVLKNAGRLEWNGDATISFNSPDQGSGAEYAGILVFQDPAAPDKGNRIHGNAKLTLEGAIYMPSQLFHWAGNTVGATECFQIVARQIEIAGNANIRNVCGRGYGSAETQLVRLVE